MDIICVLVGTFKSVFMGIFGFCLCDYLPIMHQLFPCQ